MPRFTQVLDEKQLAHFLEECEQYQLSTGTGSPSDKQLAEEQLADMAAHAIPELVEEVRQLREAARKQPNEKAQEAFVAVANGLAKALDTQSMELVYEVWRNIADVLIGTKPEFSGTVAIAQPYTEPSTQQALALLDSATEDMSDETLRALIDAAAHLLRPAQACTGNCDGCQKGGAGK